MLEYELNGKIYTEEDLINAAGGKDKLPAYIKSKGFKVANKKAKQPTKQNLANTSFGFNEEGKYTAGKDQFAEINKTKKKKIPTITPGVDDFGAQISGDVKQFSFKDTGITPAYKAKKAAEFEAKQKEVAKNAKEQEYLDKTKDYRTRVALDKLSFENPSDVTYDINKESVTETVSNLNKKLNRLGLEATEKFGDKINIKRISQGRTGVNERELVDDKGADFNALDIKGMNAFIAKIGDDTYAKKIKTLAKTKYPNLWEKITPKELSEEEKKEQATNGLIEGFKALEKSTAPIQSSMTMGGASGTPITENLFENPYDYKLYKQWKKDPNAIIELPQSRIDAWDKSRKEKFIDRASTDYARELSPEDRKNVQILVQEKVNDTRYAVNGLIKDIDDLKKEIINYNTEAALYKKTKNPDLLKSLEAKSIDLIDKQNEIGIRQKQIQKDSDYSDTVLAPAITAFGANYNRINQLANATKSTLTNVAIAFDDIAAYGSSAILGVTHDEIVKDDSLGLFHIASELNKKQQQYQKSVGIDEIDSLDDAGNWLMSGTINALPSIGMAFTGSAALPLFFASGYGGKANQLAIDAEDAKKRLSENYYAIKNTTDSFAKAQLQQQITEDENLLALPEYKKFAAKTIFGGAEVGFEMLGTLKILKGIGTATKMLPKKTIKEGLLWAGKNAVKNFNTEGLSEFGTTVTDNFADIYILGQNKNLFEGGLESYSQGGLMGTGFGGVETYNVIKRAISSELADKAQSRRIKDIANQISELTGIKGYKLDQSIPLPLQTPAVQKLVNELVDESESIESNIIGRLGVDLTIDQATEIGDINRKIREINKDFTEAANDPNLSPAQLRTLESYYRGKFNELVNQRETILTDPKTKETNIKTNKEARFEFDLTEGYQAYNENMQRTSLNKVISNFNNLNNTTKTELFTKAKAELELESVNTAEVSKKDIENRALNNYVISHYTKAIKDGAKNAQSFADDKGINITLEVIEDKPDTFDENGNLIKGKSAQEQMLDFLEKSDLDKNSKEYKEAAKNIKDNALEGANLTIKGKPIALINVPVSAQNGRTGVGAHEVLHSAVKKAFVDQMGVNKAGENLLGYLEKFNPDIYALVAERVDSSYSLKEEKTLKVGKKEGKAEIRLRDEKGEIIKDDDYYEEVLNALSDIAADGVKLPNDSLNAIRNFINNLLPSGFPKFKEDQGADVYQFVKEYNKEAHFGKKTPANVINFSGKIIGGDQEKLKASKSSKELKTELDDLRENEFDYDPDDFDQQVRNLEGKIKKAIEKEKAGIATVTKKEVTEEDTDKEIIKNERGSVSSDRVQKIYDEKGVNGAQEIIDLFKPITKKLVNKRMDAPGFDRELLTDEIETGDGGILYLIKSYKPEKGVPLAAYINKQLPLRAIAASRRVLDKDFSKDVTEEKGLIAEETVSEAKEKPKYKNALESKVFDPEVLKTLSNKVLTVTRTLKNRIDAPVTLNRTITPLISEIRDEVGRLLDIDVKTAMGGKKDDQLKKWLLKNKRYVLENMTTTWLMGKDGVGGMPQAIQKQIDGKWVSYPDWVGKKIDREKTTTDQAGRTSGAELVRRLPNVANNVTDEVYLSQVLEPSGNPIRGRKESLAKAVAEESAFDIINDDLENQGPIFEAFATNQERLGVEVASNVVAEFVRQSERGNIKFSKSLMEQLNLNQDKLANNISINGKMNLNNIRLALINTFPNWRKEDIDKVAIKLTPSMISVAKQMRTKKKVLPKDLLSNVVENIANSIDDGVAMRNKFNSNISVAEFFRNPLYRADLRILDLGFSNFILNKYGKKEGLNILSSLWMPTVAGKTANGVKAPFSIYNGVNDFNQHLEALQRNTDDGELIEINQKYKKNNTIFNNNFDGTFDKAKDKLKSDKAKELSILAAEWFSKEILKEDNTYGPEHLAAIYTLFIKENNSALRSAAPVVGTITDKRIKDIKKYDYDHSKPVSYVARRLADKFVYGLDVDLDLLFKDYEVTIIPKVVSSRLSKLGLQSMMPLNYIEGSGSAFRINAATTQAVDRYEEFINNIDVKQPIIEKAVVNSFKFSKTPKGISVFDFDDTVGLTKGSVLYTMPDGSKGKLNAEEFAKNGSNLLADGAAFDFSEFSKVVGGKPGPMVEKMKKMIGKFGPENFFILTARPANAAVPIHEFLSSIGINIPLENITGLGNSTAQAKADWMVAKAAEGYNDFYFADDAPQNVKAVQDALDVLDVKSKIQQAKLKFSKTMSTRFNEIIEENTGIENYKVYSDITARRRGLKKNRFDFYVPPSAADFELLLYKFMGKGALGEEQKQFFEDALIKPYINGVNLMDAVRQSIKREYKALLKAFPEVKKELEKLTPNKDFTYDQAMRVAIWSQFDVEIPGLSQRDKIYLTDLINNDPELAAFKDGLIAMGRQKNGWLPPSDYWDADTIVSDLYNITEGSGRKKFLGEFIENVEEIFGKWDNGKLVGPNMNKIEAAYGTNVREALEDSIYRMTNGKNRSYGSDKETAAWSSWVNGSTGSIMFLNTRSAALQMLGAVNFLNWRDNNPYNAGKAFLNQPQYWKDFATIWNSDKLKERRGGLREDVASAEIANAAAGSKNKAIAVTSYLLKIGYTPTQLADSFAIASGGAPFYRNRINSYLKEGLSEQEAEKKAWQDFSKISDETQQSGDPKDISKQQSSGAGRLLLVFQNFTMQQSRIVKKAVLDLKNGRGDAKTNIAKIAYYLAVQNIMFSTLQQGLFAVMFSDDDEEKKDKKKKTKKEAAIDVANGVLDSILRGTGFLGGIIATTKNVLVKYFEEAAKEQKAEYAKVVLEVANMSPPIGSKLRKAYSALQQTKYDKDLIKERGWGVMQDGRVHLGPMYSVTGKAVEVTTNFPMDRLVNKVENISQALNSENTAVQRMATGLGYSPWTVGIEGTKGDIKIKTEAKAKRKEEGVIKAKETRRENAERLKDSIKGLSTTERLKYNRAKALEKRANRIEKAKEKREERRKKLEMQRKLNAIK